MTHVSMCFLMKSKTGKHYFDLIFFSYKNPKWDSWEVSGEVGPSFQENSLFPQGYKEKIYDSRWKA